MLVLVLLDARFLIAAISVDSSSVSFFDAELVLVNDPENAAGSTNSEITSDAQQVKTYRVTAAQYCSFLNAVAINDTHHLYNEKMSTDPVTACIMSSENGAHYSVIFGRENFLMTYVSEASAMRYVNWLTNGQLKGEQTFETTEDGIYTFSENGEMIVAADIEGLYQVNEALLGCNLIGFQITTTSPLQTTAATIPSITNNLNGCKDSSSSSHADLGEAEKIGDGFFEVGKFIVFNVAPEFVEAFLYSKMGVFFLIPYVTWMGAEIVYALAHQENGLAGTLAVHMLFDIAYVVGNEFFDFDLAVAIGDLLEQCGLRCIATFVISVHHLIDEFVDGTIEVGGTVLKTVLEYYAEHPYVPLPS